MIKEIYLEKEIKDILTLFTPYLYTLLSGKVDKNILANKLFKYGKVIGLYENKKLVAFAGFYCNDSINNIAYLSMIAVLPEYKKRGFGKKILKEVIDISQNEGMQILKLEVFKKNIGAIKFYKALGFKQLQDNSENSLYFYLKIEESFL